jgi:hypothetical protein
LASDSNITGFGTLLHIHGVAVNVITDDAKI